jgi:thiol-disulfide isomerase/thioredoxin
MIVKIQKLEAGWCCQCKAMDRNLAQIQGVEIEHINVEEMSEDELTDLGVRNLPVCFLVDETGKRVARINGVAGAQEIIAEIEKANKQNTFTNN